MELDHYEGVDLAYYPQLKIIREVMATNLVNFPQGSCSYGSRLIKEFVGLERVIGRLKDGAPFLHEINKDSDLGIYVGVTEDQVQGIETEVTVIPFGSDKFSELEKGERNYKANMRKTRRLSFRSWRHYSHLRKMCFKTLKEQP